MVAYANPLKAEFEAVRAESAKLRREAFVQYQPVICGFRVLPVTLRSYTALVAFGNAFAAPGMPVCLEDIANFVWIHHPDFGQFNHSARKRVYRGVHRQLFRGLFRLNDSLRRAAAIAPKWLNALIRFSTRTTVKERFDAAGTEIVRLMLEAMDDFPFGERRTENDEPPTFAWQATVYNGFRRNFGMSYSETGEIPMKQLCQLWREALHTNSGGKAMLFTRREADILDEDLRRKTEAAQAALSDEEKAAIAKHREHLGSHV